MYILLDTDILFVYTIALNPKLQTLNPKILYVYTMFTMLLHVVLLS